MATHTQVVRLLAPAKLTLSLRITGTRPDGYHLIDAEMVTLDLCDEIIVRPSSQPSVETVLAPATYGSAGATPDWNIPADGSNLVIRALELAGRTAHVEVRKRIPPGAGLGGGSADAAAVLRWANRLTANERSRPRAISDALASPAPAPPSAEADAFASPAPAPPSESADPLVGAAELPLVTPQQAASLGADVAFCLVGGRARVTGIGENVEQLPFRERSFVLWTPPIHVDTAAVYDTWDKLGGPSGLHANDLEPAALAAYSELAAWRDELARASGRMPQLAGSGGTWFIPAPFGERVPAPADQGVRTVNASTVGRL